MPEVYTSGIDKNELIQKVTKLEAYINKAESRLGMHERELDKLYQKTLGNDEETYHSLAHFNLISKKRSLR